MYKTCGMSPLKDGGKFLRWVVHLGRGDCVSFTCVSVLGLAV